MSTDQEKLIAIDALHQPWAWSSTPQSTLYCQECFDSEYERGDYPCDTAKLLGHEAATEEQIAKARQDAVERETARDLEQARIDKMHAGHKHLDASGGCLIYITAMHGLSLNGLRFDDGSSHYSSDIYG